MRWTSKSTGKLATELVRQGYKITDDTVGRILKSLGYSLQAPSKQKEGSAHPDRDAQFVYLNKEVGRFMKAGQPVISVDTKKKEIVGEFSNGGAEWHPDRRARPGPRPMTSSTRSWAGPSPTGSTTWPTTRAGSRSATRPTPPPSPSRPSGAGGTRWDSPGSPTATKLLITADAGGSNGYRVKLWKVELAKLAQETGLEITVVHYPPGTSKWNRIEHRMFSFISMNWRGRPLVSYRTIVELISNTTTAKGLKIRAEEDLNYYETGTKVSAAELAAVPLTPHKFHGDWNYTIAQSVNR